MRLKLMLGKIVRVKHVLRVGNHNKINSVPIMDEFALFPVGILKNDRQLFSFPRRGKS